MRVRAAVTLAQCPLLSFWSTDEQQICSQIGCVLERFCSNFVEVWSRWALEASDLFDVPVSGFEDLLYRLPRHLVLTHQ